MDIKKEKFIAYCAVVALFVVGVVCYAAFPDRMPPDKPLRAMLNSGAGAMGEPVLFTHTNHATLKKYGIECIECHHQWIKEGGKILYLRKDDSTGEKPVACHECHKAKKAEGDDPKQPKRADALHQRCYGCHEDTGHGPGEKDCTGCHAK
jgi:hypothetical protein